MTTDSQLTPETVRSADGTTIVYERNGDGPPLVLVMGAFCDRVAPRGLAAELARDFTVFSYDRRGKGDSGDTAPYAVQREIEDLVAVLDAVHDTTGGPAAMFGHSSGAALALRAAWEGLPITSLAAYEAPYFIEGSRPVPVDLEPRVRALVAAGEPDAAVRLFMLEGVLQSAETVAAMADSPGWPALTSLAHTLPYEMACCENHHLPVDRLATITVATMVLGGAESPGWFHAAMRAVAAAIPAAELAFLPGQTHSAADDVLAPALVGYFRKVADR